MQFDNFLFTEGKASSSTVFNQFDQQGFTGHVTVTNSAVTGFNRISLLATTVTWEFPIRMIIIRL